MTAVYQFSERFRLGLGIGGESRLEDDGAIFLYPIVEWHITKAVRLIGNIRQPLPTYFLDLEVDIGTAWMASIGIQAREDRFRLDDQGTTPKGVGESHQATLQTSLTYRFQPHLLLTAYAGVGFDYLRLEDADGNNVRDDDTDALPVLGLTMTASF